MEFWYDGVPFWVKYENDADVVASGRAVIPTCVRTG
jgi:hypothetical protein